MTSHHCRIGVDFDNTIVTYDALFYDEALKKGWIPPGTPPHKKSVREAVVSRRGEKPWIELQALVYSRAIAQAPAAEGFHEFMRRAKSLSCEVVVISHKTAFAAGTRIRLRPPALKWLEDQGFFSERGFGLDRQTGVFFEETLTDKLRRIQTTGCTHFIDDHTDVLLAKDFPPGVKRLYYNSSRQKPPPGGLESFASWAEIEAYFRIETAFRSNLRRGVSSFKALSGGFNAQTFEITDAEGMRYFAKVYAAPPGDDRKRLETECQALRFLWEGGIRRVPQNFFYESRENLGVFAFVEGKRLNSNEIQPEDVDQAVGFLSSLQRLKNRKTTWVIPEASEACFSLQAYCENLNRRMAALKRVRHPALQKWLREDLEPIRKACAKRAMEAPHPDRVLPPDERVLSPSDVGFHNILRDKIKKTLVFIDFEYFGWDDPVKMLCDFLLQPDVPVPLHLAPRLAAGFQKAFPQRTLAGRFERVFPLLGIRWCLIVLNVFLPGKGRADKTLHTRQLDKARHELAFLQERLKTRDYTTWIKSV